MQIGYPRCSEPSTSELLPASASISRQRSPVTCSPRCGRCLPYNGCGHRWVILPLNRPQLTVSDTLAFATIHGAETVGLNHVCGSLSPGKKADIVMIDQAGVSSFPLNNAYGAVVLGADTSAVRCVIVNGVIRKWGHSLVDVDLAEARSLIETSRDYLLSEVGYHPDLFIDYPALDLGPPRFRP